MKTILSDLPKTSTQQTYPKIIYEKTGSISKEYSSECRSPTQIHTKVLA